LDNSCNWMVDSAVHPGACTVSEAILCAHERAQEVLDWAFEQQDEITARARTNLGAARSMIIGRFPELGRCLGSAEARAKLNRALRLAVSYRIPVLTPQVYVNGTRLCDEDTDLGLEYALSRVVQRVGGGASPRGDSR